MAKSSRLKAEPKTSTLSKAQKVLVVGDWVVDEHWVTSIHRSKTRSRTGIRHYRSLQQPDGCVITLAGAGKTTSVLYEAASYSEAVANPEDLPRRYELIGIGTWHPEDQSTLARLLRPANAFGQTHHRLTYPHCSEPTDVRLFNLGTVGLDNAPCMTTRVIRIYQQIGSEYVLLDRIDWELPHSEIRKLDPSVLRRDLEPHLKDLDAVVIKDMAKGTIDEDVILCLRKMFGQEKGTRETPLRPAWFVSSKEWLPEWRTKLPSGAVRLFIVPQVAAHAAFDDPNFSRWITGDESITREALQEIDRLANEFRNAMICVLPAGLSVLVRAKSREGAFLFKQAFAGKGLQSEGMPMASVFLPTLVSLLLEAVGPLQGELEQPLSSEVCKEMLTSAWSFTERWMRRELGRITESKSWKGNHERLVFDQCGLLRADPNELELKESRSEPPIFARWSTAPWDDSLREWEEAFEVRGVISRTSEEYGVIEIKRSMGEIDGYVCCVDSKRKVLRQLTAEIQSFDPEGNNSKSFMLKASPGAGKSYLVSKLAESHDLSLIPFNITSLQTKNDLLDCFDTIVTTQARARRKKYLVFFDEINSDLEGHAVYDAFLRPLEEGIYIRAGKAFYIGPCIWIFVGTRNPQSEEVDEGRTVKGTDFISRLSALPLPFDYPWTPADEFKSDGLARLENVYAGATLLQREFPDVTLVSEAVLEVFRVMPPKTAVRKIDRFIKRFDQIQYGKVAARNLPTDWMEYLGVSAKGVQHWEENFNSLRDRMVRIA